VRLLPWQPRLRDVRDVDVPDVGLDVDDAFGVLLVILAVLVLLPFVLAFVVFSLELLLVLSLVPLLMIGQLVGWRPWVLVVRLPSGKRRHVSVRGTRSMLEARRYYRSLRVR
jgi:hypothetical protein